MQEQSHPPIDKYRICVYFLKRRYKMRSYVKTIILLLCFLLLITCGCENDITDQGFEPTLEDIEEAEIMALCLSGEITAPQNLKEQLLDDLLYIRNNFGDDSNPIDSIRFFPPWVPGCIIIGFDDSTAQKIISGEYDAWDTLNEAYQVVEMDSDLTFVFPSVVMYFEDILNPRRLAELYEQLPGVRYSEPNFHDGDGPNVYPKIEGDGITYLFRDAWGSCTAGCMYSEYWYFGSSNGLPVFIGYWDPQENPTEPDWWSEAKQNRELYSSF
jgi:hypothetical protein